MAAATITVDATAVGAATGFELSGRHALVTGAGTAVGAAVARALARAGARVTAGGAAVTELARQLAATGDEHTVLEADMSTVEGRAALVAAGGPPVDIVVICPPAPAPVALAALTETDARAGLDAVVTAALLVTRDVLPLLRPDRNPSIVYIGWSGSGSGPAGAAVWSAAAAGLAGLTRCLAKELGPHGVRVNLVAAGPVAAERADKLAPLALFLVSDAAAGINGETLVADGGA